VKKAVPHIQYLDDEPLLENEQEQLMLSSDFDEDWKLIDELVQEGIALSDDKGNNVPGESSRLKVQDNHS